MEHATAEDRQETCCGRKPRRSVSDYVDSGLRRSRLQPLPIQGETRESDAGLAARFSLRLVDERIAAVSFKASTCATLIAYCELIAELVEGVTLTDAVRASCSDLVAQLPGVPVGKQDRSVLARSAFLAAVHKAVVTMEEEI